MENLKSERLEALKLYYMKILRLGDWTIVASIRRHDDMTLDSVGGECEYQSINKCATIHILDSIDYGDRIIPQDQEKTLVHELLHCKFSLIDSDKTIRDRVQHQLINDLSIALVEARRTIEEVKHD